jgi:hypothetical protein
MAAIAVSPFDVGDCYEDKPSCSNKVSCPLHCYRRRVLLFAAGAILTQAEGGPAVGKLCPKRP